LLTKLSKSSFEIIFILSTYRDEAAFAQY